MNRSQPPLHYYALYGKIVACHRRLPGLPRVTRRVPRPHIVIKASRSIKNRPAKWFHQVKSPNGRAWLSLGRQSSYFRIRIHGRGDFAISKNGKRILYDPDQNNVTSNEALLLTSILPLALNLSGDEILHACAVEIKGTAVVFLGPQGMGKSTLSAALVTAGFSLLTDDALRIERRGKKLWGYASFPEIRLEEKTMRNFWSRTEIYKSRPALEKRRKKIRASGKPRLPLGALVVLDTQRKSRGVKFGRIHSRDMLIELLNNSFRLDLFDRRRMEREIDTLSLAARDLPAWRLTYARDFRALPRVIKAIHNKLII